MAFKNLSNDEMAAVSGAWIDGANPASTALAQVPRLAALAPEIRAKHHALVALLAPEDGDAERAAVIARAGELDRRHDNLASAIYNYLGVVAQLESDGEKLLALRAQLLPEGLKSVVHATYRGQAGFATALQARLTSEQRDQLAALPLPTGTLLDRVDAWSAVGIQLGELEETRARAAAKAARIDPAQIVGARNAWVRMANAVVAVAALSELAPEHEALLFGPLRDAEATADARASRRSRPAKPRVNRGVSDVAPSPGNTGGEEQAG